MLNHIRYIYRATSIGAVLAGVLGFALYMGLGAGRSDAIAVISGDLIRYGGEEVRLFGIDSPPPGIDGAVEGTEHLRQLIGPPRSPRVACSRIGSPEPGVQTVSTCHVAYEDLSIAQLRNGHAVVWCSVVQRHRPELEAVYQAASDEARKAKRGIWSRPFKPWRDWGCK